MGFLSPGAALGGGKVLAGMQIAGEQEAHLKVSSHPGSWSINQPTNQPIASQCSRGVGVSLCHWARHLRNTENREGKQSPGETLCNKEQQWL